MSDSLLPYGLYLAHQAPLSMGFFRQEYWSGLPCPPPEDLPDPQIKPESLLSPALAGGYFTTAHHLGNPKVEYKLHQSSVKQYLTLDHTINVLWRKELLVNKDIEIIRNPVAQR